MRKLVVVVLLLVSLLAEVSCHGVLLQPRSRNWLAYIKESFYNSHALNAGGRLGRYGCVPAASCVPALAGESCCELAVRDFSTFTSSDRNVSITGVDVVSNKRRLTYPAGRHGYCGDAHNEKRWDVPGTTQATYTQGQVSRQQPADTTSTAIV